ncbi:MAG: hypothetical protein JST73_07425, partial [Actinobacteria bacterium]|nr:hypothetical protein [Actinomycetota bacterium]
MNALQRLTSGLTKIVAGAAIMVAGALPLAAASAAGAATTAPTLTSSSASNPLSFDGYAVVGQGFTGAIGLTGTGFANDAALGGQATLSTNATGVTFTSVTETSSTAASAQVVVSPSTPTGFYTLTLTDDNGTSSPMTIGLAVVDGPQVASVTGNTVAAGGSSAVALTGPNLDLVDMSNSTLSAPAGITATWASTPAATATSATINVSVSGSVTPGTYTISATDNGSGGSGALGMASIALTVTSAAAPPVSITSTTEMAAVASGSSTQNFSITGTGFLAGATVQVYAGGSCSTSCAAATGISLAGATVTVNSATSITVTGVTITATAATQYDVKVTNPNATGAYLTDGVGVGEPGATGSSTPIVAPVAPQITSVTYVSPNTSLAAGVSAIAYVTGTTGFPLSTGSTVTLAPSATSPSTDVVTGTVLSVSSSNVATVKFLVPRYGYTTVTSATTAGAQTTLAVANAADVPSSATLVVGSTLYPLAISGTTATSITFTSTTLPAVPAGAVVEYAYPNSSTFVLTANNGANVETHAASVGAPAAAAVTDALGQAVSGDVFAPGTYTVNADVPGFNFGSSASVAFASSSGITGTVSTVNSGMAKITFKVPASQPDTGITLANAAPATSATLVLAGTIAGTDLAAGSKLTIDAGQPNAETVTVASTYVAGSSTVPLTTTLQFAHLVGAAVSGINLPTGAVSNIDGVLFNGSGWAYDMGAIFNTGVAPTSATVTASPATLVSGNAQTLAQSVTFTVPTTNNDHTAANWKVTSSNANVTFTTTSATATTVVATASVMPATPAGNVTVTITDGVTTYTLTMAVVVNMTITGLTATGTALTTTGTNSVTLGVYGTGFAYGNDVCYVANGLSIDPGVACTVDNAPTNSATVLTVTITAGLGALNGTDTLVIADGTGANGSAAALNAVVISGQPTVTSVAPASILSQPGAQAVTFTGTGFDTTSSLVAATEYDSTGVSLGSATVATTSSTATTVVGTISLGGPDAGGYVLVTLQNSAHQLAYFKVPVVAGPQIMHTSTISPTSVVVGSTSVPFPITGGGFLPGATVTLPTGQGTATVTTVTWNKITGTLSIPATATVTGSNTLTVKNTDGGVDTGLSIATLAAPTITLVKPTAGVAGSKGSIVITGGPFLAGATVTASNTGLATLGAPVVSSSVNTTSTCASYVAATSLNNGCDTITVPVTYVSFSGGTPLSFGLTVTNPAGYG